jgi:hypothetical protein
MSQISNRPGLPAIAYRVGTYASFRQSAQARLSAGGWEVLRQLRTRADDDFTMALVDAWAITADILTFYQERIANESYLRTATERFSILEQARLLGYQPGPGVAASTHLAFTMEEAPGAPEQAAKPNTLAAGTKVQSVPGPDELPQTFETIEAIEARVEWNAIRPKLTESQALRTDMRELWLEGASLQLAVGDVLLIVAEAEGVNQAVIHRVITIKADAAANRTRVLLSAISDPAMTETDAYLAASPPGVYAMRAAPSVFGHNAPLEAHYSSTTPGPTFLEWTLVDAEVETRLLLSTRHDKILPGSWIVIGQFDLKDPSGPFEVPNVTWTWIVSRVLGVTHLSIARYGMAGIGTLLVLSSGWKRINPYLALLRTMTLSAQSEALQVTALPVTYPVYGATIALNTRMEGLQPGRPIAVTGKHQRLRITELSANSPFEGIDLPGSDTVPWIDNLEDAMAGPLLFLAGNERVELQPGDRLILAAPPVRVVGLQLVPLSPSEFGALLAAPEVSYYVLLLTDRDGRSGFALLPSLWFALDPATDLDETISAISFLGDMPDTAIVHNRDRTTLHLASPLPHVFDRATLRLNANVAAATHGETVKELLGSGDATVPYQRFTLRQPPLTHVTAETPTGSASTLSVFVNDVLWREVPFFYGHGPTERIYVTRRDDSGVSTIQFGDGITGARLPTGQNNVRAEYRKGVGLAGLVEPGQLSLLMSRPLGLSGVVNPEAAQGAADPETRDDARTNAPLTVLTLERAVSLQDYEDFARTFSGIAKAQAVWVWDGRRRCVFLTVSGPEGDVLEAYGPIISSLVAALRQYGDPLVALAVKSYRPVLFQVHGTVTVDADHVVETVLAAVKTALQERYRFEARAFGQSAALSELIAVTQAVPGVVAVDIDKFYRSDRPTPELSTRLVADRPAMGADGLVLAAELLLLDEASLTNLKAIP